MRGAGGRSDRHWQGCSKVGMLWRCGCAAYPDAFPMSAPLTPGLLILHGNQMEQLRAAVFAWLRQHPLAPLEQETLLVQSNGVAEWLKIAIAEDLAICAATRVALPGRFLWEAYRGMLGRDQVPARSAFDKGPLTWRLMRLLPALLNEPVFAPLRHFLGDGDPERRLQLAERLADLFDQYQVYRADWLMDWAAGRDQLRSPGGEARALAPDQRWQAQLWRSVIASLAPAQRGLGRADVHARFVDAADSGAAPLGRLPRRVVLFGVSSLPYQSLQALAALARHCQVLLAVPNPCQFYWGDIIDGRELLRAQHKRQRQRGGVDLAALPFEQMHAHSHPLLASWGRQGRDFVRMLDEFDSQSQRDDQLRIDLFSEGEGDTVLAHIQGAVRDMLPLAEHRFGAVGPDDRSLEFHVAHSVQREVEVLHDQLLGFLAGGVPGLRPREVVVMVPAIDTFSAAIEAVFGQHKRGDARFIPYEIGDVNDRSVNPLLVALDWLLRLPQQRCRQSEVRDLLDVPSLATRFGLAADDLPTLGRWIEGAGVRWGLDQSHRDGLGLGPAGEQNGWMFGLRRMLLGYASGATRFHDIEPYAEVGGLDAALAGSLAQLVEALLAWRATLAQARTPADWGDQARALLAAFFSASSEPDRLTLGQLNETLQQWLDVCENAEFTEAVPLAVLREAWLGAYDEPTLDHQFVSGGVTFCTLMPMRAVPFRVVCLLGMNDGDFPRRAPQADFDLLALPGMARPGDRSRRDDDRYLMLEALLAARDKLLISWVGRNVRDNSEQPASVLVSQLRDYVAAGWDIDLDARTTVHPLQPFSRRYFEGGSLTTYAGEWSAAYGGEATAAAAPLPPFEPEPGHILRLAALTNFLRQPARYFFRHRLGVKFDEVDVVGEDDEPFSFDGLEQFQLMQTLLDDHGMPEPVDEARAVLSARAERMGREGQLPIGLAGERWQQQLVGTLLPVRQSYLRHCHAFPEPAPKLAVSLTLAGLRLEDWVDRLRSNGVETVALAQSASKVLDKFGKIRADKLIAPWLRQLACAAIGTPVTGYLFARDAMVMMAPLDQAGAIQTLEELARLWLANLHAPLPLACRTALALVRGQHADKVYNGTQELDGEVSDVCLARLWPTFAALSAEPQWEAMADALYRPLAIWADALVPVPFAQAELE